MGTTITRSNVGPSDEARATGVLEHVAASRKRNKSHQPGTLEVVRLLREVRRSDPGALEVELVFAARPASKRSHVQNVHFSFTSGDAVVPAPSLDKETATIHLHYPKAEQETVIAALSSRHDRFCYFWQAADGSQMRAWLFIPQ